MWSQFVPPYLALLGAFADVIESQIYGHDHTDSFRFLFPEPLSTVRPISPPLHLSVRDGQSGRCLQDTCCWRRR